MVNKSKNNRNEGQFDCEIIPGLPDEIAMECLVKVPYQFHTNMKSVCHTWQTLISHPSFYQERLKSGNSEHLVCLVQPLSQSDSSDDPLHAAAGAAVSVNKEAKQNDPDQQFVQEEQQQPQQIHTPPQFAVGVYNLTQNTWQRTRPHGGQPMFCQCLSIPKLKKVLLLGGWDSTTLEPVRDVYILDLVGGCKWRKGASMSVSRSFFACGVLDSTKVYVAGGHDGQKNALKSAEIYDVEKDEWQILPDMIEERDECQGLVWDDDGRFWVVSGYGTDSQGQFRSDAECYDPKSGVWSKFDGVWPFSSISPRGATAAVTLGKNQYQWWWFLGGDQQREQGNNRRDVKENEVIRLEMVSSFSVPGSVNGSNPCVISLGNDPSNKHVHQVFVMNGNGNVNGRRLESCSSEKCSECDCQGAFIMNRDCNNGSTKWNHVHTPVGFSGFPFSACHLTI